jgi:hypothetical protein
LLVPEPEPAVQAELITDPTGTPWERREELGLLSGWLQTMQQALLEPVKLFSSARLDRGSAQLGFAVLTTSVFSVLGQLLGLLFGGNDQAWTQQLMHYVPADSPFMPYLRSQLDAARHPHTMLRTLLPLLATPLVSLVFIYLNAAVTHLVALLIGQSKRGFPATFAACAYACAPLALCAVPACGAVIGALWLIVLTGVGMKVTHKITSGGAAASVLMPYVLCCCAGGLASIALASTLAKMLGAQ